MVTLSPIPRHASSRSGRVSKSTEKRDAGSLAHAAFLQTPRRRHHPVRSRRAADDLRRPGRSGRRADRCRPTRSGDDGPAPPHERHTTGELDHRPGQRRAAEVPGDGCRRCGGGGGSWPAVRSSPDFEGVESRDPSDRRAARGPQPAGPPDVQRDRSRRDAIEESEARRARAWQARARPVPRGERVRDPDGVSQARRSVAALLSSGLFRVAAALVLVVGCVADVRFLARRVSKPITSPGCARPPGTGWCRPRAL